MMYVLALFTLLFSSPAWSQTWPNEPSGSTLLTDFAWNASSGSGWYQNGGAYISSDATAPLSPSNVLTFRYGSGYGGGGSPDIVFTSVTSAGDDIWYGYWWKANAGWQAHPTGVNKISFLFNGNSSGLSIMIMQGTSPYGLVYYHEMPTVNNCHMSVDGDCGPSSFRLWGNTGNSGQVVPGNWYRIEVYQKKSTSSTSRDGIVRWWVNGVKIGDYNNLNYPDVRWSEFQFSPTWGGVGSNKTQTDYYWFDHVRISTGGTASGGTKTDTIPPGVPMGLRAQ